MHFKTFYPCGVHIYMQCKCPSESKTINTVWGKDCPKCVKESVHVKD